MWTRINRYVFNDNENAPHTFENAFLSVDRARGCVEVETGFCEGSRKYSCPITSVSVRELPSDRKWFSISRAAWSGILYGILVLYGIYALTKVTPPMTRKQSC